MPMLFRMGKRRFTARKAFRCGLSATESHSFIDVVRRKASPPFVRVPGAIKTTPYLNTPTADSAKFNTVPGNNPNQNIPAMQA